FDQLLGFDPAAAQLQVPRDDLARAAVGDRHQARPAVPGDPDARQVELPELPRPLDPEEAWASCARADGGVACRLICVTRATAATARPRATSSRERRARSSCAIPRRFSVGSVRSCPGSNRSAGPGKSLRRYPPPGLPG